MQVIFAGKSHPADYQSKQLLKRVYLAALDKGFQGRIAFVEDYDLNLSRELVRGVDVWLNNPRRLQEACGTSGMKASMNGVLNLSVRDGWWDEAYNGKNGWAIDNFQGGTSEEEDKTDAESLYKLLENEIVPLYYNRDRKGIPHQWIKYVKEAVKTITPAFNGCRMMKEYTQEMYLPAAGQEEIKNNFEEGKKLEKHDSLAQLFFNQSDVFMVAISSNEIVVDINKKACEILDYSIDEIKGQELV